jgi:hypothetical protein
VIGKLNAPPAASAMAFAAGMDKMTLESRARQLSLATFIKGNHRE